MSDATSPIAPYRLSVNFGDGIVNRLGRQSVPDFTITHTYANAGTYTVVLTFNDDAGNEAQATFQVIVSGFTVNNGAPQQSMVKSLTYVFAGPVQVEPEARSSCCEMVIPATSTSSSTSSRTSRSS